jgi:hypothetical protein
MSSADGGDLAVGGAVKCHAAAQHKSVGVVDELADVAQDPIL